MEKNIVSESIDAKGNVIDSTADYIGVENFTKSIEELYRECLDNFDDKELFEQYINDLYGDENHIHACAAEFALHSNEDMKKYLHMSNHHMVGNFANVELDYDGDFQGMVKRLDSAEDSEQAGKDREFLAGWFFGAVGTFGIKYNFSNDLQELHDSYDEMIEDIA